MKIFSKHRKKMEPKRRFGGLEFRKKVKSASNYKRLFNPNPQGRFSKFLSKIGLASKLWRFVAVVFILAMIYYVFISPVFIVAKVKVSGNAQVASQEVNDAIAAAGNSRLFFIPKNSMFLMSGGNIKNILTQRLPLIKEIASSKRIWPNEIEIEIKERIPGFVIESNGKFFLIDEDGIVFDQITDPEKLLVIHDQQVEDFARGEVLGNSKLASFVLSMSRQWGTKVGTLVEGIRFGGKNTPDVQFDTVEGWSVMFDTTRPVVVQLNNLGVLLNKTISAQDRAHLAYIDLRLERKLFICLKEKPCGQAPVDPSEITPAETPPAPQPK